MAVYCVAAERGGLIKRKEKKFMGKTLRPSRLTSSGLINNMQVIANLLKSIIISVPKLIKIERGLKKLLRK